MLTRHIMGATRVLAKDQPEFLQLPIRDMTTETGQPFMVSAWEVTPTELQALSEGALIRVRITTTNGVRVGGCHLPTAAQMAELEGGASVYVAIGGTVHPPILPDVGKFVLTPQRAALIWV